jgi:hypothetical protein
MSSLSPIVEQKLALGRQMRATRTQLENESDRIAVSLQDAWMSLVRWTLLVQSRTGECQELFLRLGKRGNQEEFDRRLNERLPQALAQIRAKPEPDKLPYAQPNFKIDQVVLDAEEHQELQELQDRIDQLTLRNWEQNRQLQKYHEKIRGAQKQCRVLEQWKEEMTAALSSAPADAGGADAVVEPSRRCGRLAIQGISVVVGFVFLRPFLAYCRFGRNGEDG